MSLQERTAAMAEQEGPKIIVDTDWKSQAQAEKERLAAKEKAAKPAAPAGAAPGGAPGAEGDEMYAEPPKPDFEELVRMLATQALLYLGAFPDPESGRRMVSLEMAQFQIEMLGMLEEKTKNNLSEQEKTMLTRMLYELRLQYVEISKAVAKAVEQGKISPSGGPGMGGMGGAMAGGGINIKPPAMP
jgi:hypothetical protein